MIRIEGLKLPFYYDEEALRAAAAKALAVGKREIGPVTVVREATDGRKKPKLYKVVTAECSLPPKKEAAAVKRGKGVAYAVPYVYELPENRYGGAERPVVVGAGPAGLFGGLVLAKAGLKPLILEAGEEAAVRRRDILSFCAGGPLKEHSNIEFGEGGAGMFSDGKLTTGTKDRRHRFIIETMIGHGAPESIGYLAKPHIGSDYLGTMTENLRRTILSLGGSFRFRCRLTDFRLENGGLKAIVVTGENGEETIPCDRLLLAVGHSARSTAARLYELGADVARKPFSVGVRIEHLQRELNIAQYGAENAAVTADYKLSCHLANGRSVYTFCMCPGGVVVPASSEPGTVVTNGMSEWARGGENGNSALLVSVRPDDFPGDDPFGGVRFQRELEEKAFALGGGGYFAPAQRAEDFLAGRVTSSWGKVRPTYRPGVTMADLNALFPAFVRESLKEALPLLGKKLSGFDDGDAVLTAAETRSSSPYRILRDENGSSALYGVFPAGEGSGYAGGIMSSAADGMRVAEAIIKGS